MPSSVFLTGEDYLERYFRTFPSRATTAGRHDHDRELESLDREQRDQWLAYNEAASATLAAVPAGDADDRLDALLLRREIDREIFRLKTLHVPERNPLYWTEIAANSVVFLLVRDHRPADAIERAKQIPRLVRNAEKALGPTEGSLIAPEICAIAAGQAKASASFFRDGFVTIDRAAGTAAADALDELSRFIADLQKRATGTPRLGNAYRENLRLATGVLDPDALLAQAERDLAAKKQEAAAYARSIWKQFVTAAPPAVDEEVLRAMFERAARDHHTGTEEWVAYGTKLVDEAEAFVRAHDLVTLPEPRTLVAGRSPSYFTGQSVGGVYPAGPFDPEANTLYFMPVPPDSATPAQREGFFRDFNDHFQRMITPHEMMPGHYVQLKYAARNPHKLRALFPDDVYVEGWGTFSERLALDLGWGGPLDRIAHLKKQMENIARTIVDIRVHTRGMTREEVIGFATREALQDQQFAANMWTRSITTSPQLTYYYLGYVAVRGLYDEVRHAQGSAFHLRDFTDTLMRLGPVPIEQVRRRMLPAASSSATVPAN